MAAICEHYKIAPCHYWLMDADEEAALVDQMRETSKAQRRAARRRR